MLLLNHSTISIERASTTHGDTAAVIVNGDVSFLVDAKFSASSQVVWEYGDDRRDLRSYNVFRCGDSVVWARSWFSFIKTLDDLFDEWGRRHYDLDDLYLFETSQYENVIGGGSVSQLPEVSHFVLAWMFLSVNLPTPEEVLYREPATRGDPYGRGISAVVWHWYNETVADKLRTFTRCPEPTLYTTVRLGLDGPGCAEACWDYTIAVNRLFIRFVDNPKLAIWLTSDVIVDADLGE